MTARPPSSRAAPGHRAGAAAAEGASRVPGQPGVTSRGTARRGRLRKRGRGRGWRVPDIRAQPARLTLHSVRGATCFYGRDTGAKVTICPTRHRQEMQDRIHGVQTESARPLPAAPLSRTPCLLAFVTRRPPQSPCSLNPPSGLTPPRLRPHSLPGGGRGCPSCVLGLSASLRLPRPARAASGDLHPAASRACWPSGAASPPWRGRSSIAARGPGCSHARLFAASTFFRMSAVLQKQETSSPQGDPPGAVMDRTCQPCSALHCPAEQDRATGGGRRALQGPCCSPELQKQACTCRHLTSFWRTSCQALYSATLDKELISS